MPSKSVATKNDQQQMDLFSQDTPEYIDRNSHRGDENVTTDDLTIPRIVLIQDLSPQYKKDKPEYIEGANVGDMFNTVTNQVYGNNITIIPVLFRKEFIIWKDRKAGGGFRGAYPTYKEAQAAMAALDPAEQPSCKIKDTAQQFVIIVDGRSTMDNPVFEEAVISLSGGLMGASRNLNSMCKMAGGDRFSRAYKMASVEVKGAKGEYKSYKFHPLGYVSETLYRLAEASYAAITAGERDVDRRSDAEPAATDESLDDEF